MIESADSNNFEVWFDDTLMETSDKSQKLPPLSEEQKKRLNDRLDKTFEKFFGKNDYDESTENLRVAV